MNNLYEVTVRYGPTKYIVFGHLLSAPDNNSSTHNVSFFIILKMAIIHQPTLNCEQMKLTFLNKYDEDL